MLVYLSNLKNRFSGLLNGLGLHAGSWTGQPETTVTIQANIDSIDAMQTEVSQMEDALIQKKAAARKLENELDEVADTITKKAIGFHSADPVVLVDYDIKVRGEYQKKPIPSKVIAASIKDDFDGQGFILSVDIDPDADRYEWEKGVATDPKDLNTIPTLKLFKVTPKLSFVDDEVVSGVRCFYRVRATNRSGNGAWSAPVSKVQ